MSDRLRLIEQEQLEQMTAIRPGETKLGEGVVRVNSPEELEKHSAPFVLLGIKEDIGIRANLGQGGATDCWDHALAALLNVQSNRFIKGDELIVLGELHFADLLVQASDLDAREESDLAKLRELTAEIDQAVYETIEKIVKQGKTPIIIGGGHNNAYGNIHGTAQALGSKISVLNIDPHTDYRALEGRHSGNGFRYAREAYLDQYAVYGLHEGYNGEDILEKFQTDQGLHFESFENILHQSEGERQREFLNLLNWFGDKPIGLELDLDCLTRFPVSALNPSGFSLNEVRKLVRTTASLRNPRYFHICEGSPGLAAHEQEKQLLGKSIAYLITDFIKSHS